MISPDASPWLPWLVCIPLIGGIAAFLLPRLAMHLGLGAGALVGFCAAGLVGEVLRHGPARYSLGGWGAPLGIDLFADGLSVWMVAVTSVIGAAVSIYSTGYFPAAPDGSRSGKRRHFWPLWMFLWAGLNALFLSADVFNLYVSLELVGFSAVGLTALGMSPEALKAAMRYMLASLLGSLAFLLGVALLYARYATVDLALLAKAADGDAATFAALASMTGGLLLKGAAFPLHFWLPPAHSSAPAPVSALLSALVVKAPFYILLRLWFTSFISIKTVPVSLLLGALGAIALIWGAAHAIRQKRLKMLVAYSTVAQLGYLFLVFPLAHATGEGSMSWNGALFFLAAHACAKTALFMAAGNVLHALGHDEIARLGGLARALPKSTVALLCSGVSLIGLPPSGGFIAKWQLLQAAIQQGEWIWVAVIFAGTALAIGYIMRVVGPAFAGTEDLAPVARVPAPMEWTTLALAVLAAGMGLASALPLDLLSIGPSPVAVPGIQP